jgi:hypothetical protein
MGRWRAEELGARQRTEEVGRLVAGGARGTLARESTGACRRRGVGAGRGRGGVRRAAQSSRRDLGKEVEEIRCGAHVTRVQRSRRRIRALFPRGSVSVFLLRIESKMAHIPSHSPALFHRCLYLFITSITPRGSFMQEEKRVKRKSQNERRQRGG